ncbi:MAG: sigma-70 family RNA polymerase sigma factor [Gemmataceae bacterium]
MPPHSASLLHYLRHLAGPAPADVELLRRWIEQRDEDAFTALVARHGRMVHGVCRRVLGNSHDADDAFQAVFLILARKAGTLRHPEKLVGWLHGVALRLANKGRAAAAHRLFADSRAPVRDERDPQFDPLDVLSARELLALIDREIAALPDAYRLPLLLCDVEERTQQEAARLLGWTLGSLRGRLSRGRAKLRERLLRRGVAPETLSVLLAAGLTRMNADAAVPLASGVSRLAVLFSDCPTSAAIPQSVAALARAGLSGMTLMKLKILSAFVLTIGLMVGGVGMAARFHLSSPVIEEQAESKLLFLPPAKEEQPRVRLDQAGDPLPDEALARLGTTRLRHGGMIDSVAFTPDGKTLVSEAVDGLRIWEAATGKQIRRVVNGYVGGYTIDISPDGKLMAVPLPARNFVGLREVATGRLVRSLSRRREHFVRFSPDGKKLVTLGYHSEIDMWDTATGKALNTLKGHRDEVGSAMFSSDGKTLVSGSDDKTIRFWDVAAGKQLRQIETDNGVDKVALSPNGRYLATLGHVKHSEPPGFWWQTDALIHLRDTSTGKTLRRLTMSAKEISPGVKGGFRTLSFTPDSKTLITGGSDGVIRLWDTATGTEVRRFAGFGSYPISFALRPDGQALAVVDGSTIRLIRLDTGTDLFSLEGHSSGIRSVLQRPDNRTVVTAGWDGLLRFWDARTGKARRSVAGEQRSVLRILPDGRRYLASDADKKLRVRDLDTGAETDIVRGWNGHQFEPIVLAPDGRTFAQFEYDKKTVDLLNPATGKILHGLTGFNMPFMGMSFTPDGRDLFLWSIDKTVTVWDVATGAKRRQFTGPVQTPDPRGFGSPVFGSGFSPDGKLLAFALQDHFFPLWDAVTGKEALRFEIAKDGVSSFAFSPDGKSLAWGGWRDGAVYLGEVATGRERRRFLGHQGRISALSFSDDGQTLISGSEDATALVWDLTGRLASGGKSDKPLSADDLKLLWDALAAEDAAAGFRAIQALSADPERAVPYLRPRLHPVAVVDEERLKRLIADLDNDQFNVRDNASKELEQLGEAALHAMRKAIEDRPTLEKRRRLEPLVQKQEREEWKPSAEGRRTGRALEVLERAGTAEARRVLAALAAGAPGARLTLDAKAALERLNKRSAAKP